MADGAAAPPSPPPPPRPNDDEHEHEHDEEAAEAAAAEAERAAIAAVTGGGDDSSSSSSSSPSASSSSSSLSEDEDPRNPAAAPARAIAGGAGAGASAVLGRLAGLRVDLIRTVSGVGQAGRQNGGGGGGGDDPSDEESSDSEESGASSSGGGSGGDGEDEAASGAGGAGRYGEVREQRATPVPAPAPAAEVLIEEEEAAAAATVPAVRPGSGGSRWGRTALDSAVRQAAGLRQAGYGFRGRYAAAATATTAANTGTGAAGSGGAGAPPVDDAADGGGSLGPPLSPRSPKAASSLPLGILPHPSPMAAAAGDPASAAAASAAAAAAASSAVPPDPHADQVQRILALGIGPANGEEMEDFLSSLRPGQYPLLLGRGMLGVNLRQTYGSDQNFGAAASASGGGAGGAGSTSGSHGVYVDYVVPRGNAERSGVVRVGDRLVRLGEDSVERGTIGDVPRRVADLKRPGVLVLASGKELDAEEDGGAAAGGGRMDWIDASIGLINLLAGENAAGGDLVLPKLRHENAEAGPPMDEWRNRFLIGATVNKNAILGRLEAGWPVREAFFGPTEATAEAIRAGRLRSRDKGEALAAYDAFVRQSMSEGAVVGESGGPLPLVRGVSLFDADDGEENVDEEETEGGSNSGSAEGNGEANGDVSTSSRPDPDANVPVDIESPYNILVPSVGVTTPLYPSSSVCKELIHLASKRANPTGSISAGTINSLFEDLQMAEEEQKDNGGDTDDALLTDDLKIAKRMTNAFHEALVTICLDPRRSHFLTKHMEHEDTKAVEARKKAVKEMGLPPSDVDEELDRRNSAAILLNYYLDLTSYFVAMEALPMGRKIEEQMRLADAFRDLTTSNLLADRDALASIKTTLDDMLVKGSATQIDNGLVDQLRILVGHSIAISPHFVTFLLGDQCARMRGYLHKTAPYAIVPLSPVTNGTVEVRRGQSLSPPSAKGAHAHNHLLFALLHLLCRYEKDEESEEERQGMPVPDKDKTRIMGSAGGVACAVFIQGTLLPVIDEAQRMLQQHEGRKDNDSNACASYRSVVVACEQLWEAYVAPAGGILAETIPEDSERLLCLVNDVRRALVGVVSLGDQPRGRDTSVGNNVGRKVVQGIVSSTELKVSLEKLAEELMTAYAISIRPEYRAHMFHEWMCGEVHRWSKKRVGASSINNAAEDAVLTAGIYPMSEGSITRLMRRVELPTGISQHRPQRLEGSSPEPTGRFSATSTAECPDNAENPTSASQYNLNAEYAVVFGNDDGMDSTGRVLGLDSPNANVDFGAVRRFTCVKLRGQAEEPCLDEDDIPPTIENYAVVPPIRELPFANIIDEGRLTTDGWEVSLVNFMVPNSNPGAAASDDSGDGPFIYGVSLVFNQIGDGGTEDARGSLDQEKEQAAPKYTTELECVETSAEGTSAETNGVADGAGSQFATPSKSNQQQVSFLSPITISRQKKEKGSETDEILRKIRVSAQTPEFNRRLGETRWSERVKKRKLSGGVGATIGIALLSGRNSIPAMRDTLSQLFDDYTNVGTNMGDDVNILTGGKTERVCDLLVDILGTLSQIGVEQEALRCILEPYLEYGNSRWIARAPSDQNREFATTSGAELLESLPPIPLALLFVTLLLEQKIIVSSRRRSLLVSATTSLRSLLNPLTWSHLFVPLVPASMAGDLIHYPAPFILGVPSEDEDSMVLLNSLPDDVTLVDLDVGRVILASTLSNEEGMDPGMLRSQVLFLAETLGSVFGCKMQGPTWRCDSPLRPFSQVDRKRGNRMLAEGAKSTTSLDDGSQFAAVKQLCKEFIIELLSGTRSCCYWIEEKHPGRVGADTHECSVLFDEDRFFSIKRLRAEERYMPLLMGEHLFQTSTSPASDLDGPIGEDTILALNPDDFDLVLEVFLRCQGMSTFVSSMRKERMAFW